MIKLICGAPGTGKSTLASTLFDGGNYDKVFCTDIFTPLPWSEQSAAVVGLLIALDSMPSHNWIVEGTALSRALRKFKNAGMWFKSDIDMILLEDNVSSRYKFSDVLAQRTILRGILDV